MIQGRFVVWLPAQLVGEELADGGEAGIPAAVEAAGLENVDARSGAALTRIADFGDREQRFGAADVTGEDLHRGAPYTRPGQDQATHDSWRQPLSRATAFRQCRLSSSPLLPGVRNPTFRE
jgi:hypothetical protein